MQFLRGAEDLLAERGVTLLLKVVGDLDEAVATLRRWRETGRVVGVIVADLVPDDQRLSVLREIGLPAVILGPPLLAPGFATVSTDNASTMREAMDYLAAAGHRCVGRVTGPHAFMHTAVRDDAFAVAGIQLGVETRTAIGDYTAEGGARATEQLIAATPRPTAVIFDNDVMAIAGLDVIRRAGLSIPEQVAVLAWNDSVHCQLATPPLSALMFDLPGYGAQTARVLLDVLDGATDPSEEAEPPQLMERASTRTARKIAVG
jgi:DNA-binding LacI/PurR family transcriptional regulator